MNAQARTCRALSMTLWRTVSSRQEVQGARMEGGLRFVPVRRTEGKVAVGSRLSIDSDSFDYVSMKS